MLIESVFRTQPYQYLPSTQVSANSAVMKESSDQGSRPMPRIGNAQEMFEDINKRLEKMSDSVKFEYHEKTKRMMVTIVEEGSGKVIAELPSRKVLDVVAGLLDHQSTGLIMDYRA